MTKHGKCETCRRRKVKCDEKSPVCSPCLVKDRPCYYPYVEPIISSHQGREDQLTRIVVHQNANVRIHANATSLKLKWHKKARNGGGAYLAFEPTRLKPPRCALMCPQTEQVGKAASIFGHEGLQLNPFGIWIKLAWSSTPGDNTCLELASQYTLDSMLAFQSGHDPRSLRQARHTAEVAIRKLQSEIESCSTRDHKLKLLVAVMLHWAAERFIEHGSWRYIPHFLGARKLLEGCHADDADDAEIPVIQNVVSMICVDDVVSSILWDQCSPLELIVRPSVSTSGPPNIEYAMILVEKLLVKLPRLIRRVRHLWQDLSNIECITDAAELAEELYNSDAGRYIEATIKANSSTKSSILRHDSPPIDETLEFQSLDAFKLVTRYHMHRLIICSVVHSLITRNKATRLFLPRITALDVEEGETAAATSLAMCSDYAMHSGPAQPLAALALLIPLQICVASWYRFQNRATMDEARRRHALQMMEWSSKTVVRIKEMWRGRWQSWTRTQSLCDIFVGGPLPEGWFRYQDD